jgi:hypothetical protein
MNKATHFSMIAILATGLALGGSAAVRAEGHGARDHLGHAAVGMKGMPGGMGFMQTANKAGMIAHDHIAGALQSAGDVDAIKAHTQEVINALTGSAGLIEAAEGLAVHVGAAANSEDASANVKLHAEHVIAGANNTAMHAKAALTHANGVMGSSSAKEAMGHVNETHVHIMEAFDGADANKDGSISWKEGGLTSAHNHMMIMMKGEKIQMKGHVGHPMGGGK